MVNVCGVLGCKNSRNNSLSFHIIPKDEKLRKLWLEVTPLKQNRRGIVATKVYVCSRHFLPSDFLTGGIKRKIHLKRNAVPSVFSSMTEKGTGKSRYSTKKIADDTLRVKAYGHQDNSSDVFSKTINVSTCVDQPASQQMETCDKDLETVKDKYEVCDKNIAKLLQWITNMELSMKNLNPVRVEIAELKKQLCNDKNDLDKQQLLISSAQQAANGEQHHQCYQDWAIKCDDVLSKMTAVMGELEKAKDDVLPFVSWLKNTQKKLIDMEKSTSNVSTVKDNNMFVKSSSNISYAKQIGDAEERISAYETLLEGTARELVLANEKVNNCEEQIKTLSRKNIVMESVSDKMSKDLEAALIIVNKYEKMCLSYGHQLKGKNDFNMTRAKSSNDYFSYYTGFKSVEIYNVFCKFINPEDAISFSKKLSIDDQLLLVMSRLRQGFDLHDLAFRFNINEKLVSKIFDGWINEFHSRLKCFEIFPDRKIILENAPLSFQKNFPNTVLILECTEFKIKLPSSLLLSYKGLIGCDPRGGIMFVSQLFSESITVKQIIQDSGLYALLKRKIEIGEILQGDTVMVDKGFDIKTEIQELGLVHDTRKMDSCRIHVEKAIRHAKVYKLVDGPIQLTLMPKINQIWTICCMLSNFNCPTYTNDALT